MKNPDFQGIYKFKLVMPIFFVINVLLFFFGPALCPNLTQILYFVWTILSAMKALHMGFVSFYCLYQNERVIHRLENQLNLKVTQGLPEILHAIIIPNYNEPIEVIKQTLTKLSKHSRATQTYFIYLAMQKKELNCERKAQQLINEFSSRFRNIDFTVHQLQPNEYPSKAANVNLCSRRLEEKFKQMNQSIEDCFITIIDTDAELPELYFVEMEEHIRKHWEQRFNFVFGPFNIFNKNSLKVPAVTRVFDHMVSSFQMSNIVNITGFGFAISNYSASYKLVKKIDFWDTNEQSITEDLHFMQKACLKTEGRMKTVAIFVPANEMSIQTGNGYWEDVQAKFWTTQRQFRSCNEIAYALRMFFNNKFNWKTFRMTLTVLDTLALQAFYPIVMFAIAYHKSILTPSQMAELPISYQTLDFVAKLSLLGLVLIMINYEIISRRSNKSIFGNKNREWYKFSEVLILFPVVLYLMIFPANVIAIFGSLKTNRTWFMARNIRNEKNQ